MVGGEDARLLVTRLAVGRGVRVCPPEVLWENREVALTAALMGLFGLGGREGNPPLYLIVLGGMHYVCIHIPFGAPFLVVFDSMFSESNAPPSFCVPWRPHSRK